MNMKYFKYSYPIYRYGWKHKWKIPNKYTFHKSRCTGNIQSYSTNNDSYDVIVIGGGIIGTSVAYHLSKLGNEVLLLERDQLTSGTTWHAAGLLTTFGSLSSTSTYLRQYSKELYSKVLPNETNMDCGYKDVGFIEIASDYDHYLYYKRVANYNRLCGINVEEISPNQIQDLFPLCRVDDIYGGFYVKDDGRVNPYDVTMALAKGAKQNGVVIKEHCEVTDIVTTKTQSQTIPTVYGVDTKCGQSFHTRKGIVNCAGMWARQLGEELNNVTICNQAAEHYYLITEPMDEVNPNWPVIEDPSKCTYIRPEGGGLMIGLFERKGESWNTQRIPNDFSFGEISPNWDRMMPYLEEAMSRVPQTMNVGAKSFFCGPESFTPDNMPMVGEIPDIQKYYVAAGMNSIGILTGGGIGKIVADWVDTGHSPKDVDVTSIHANRFHRYQNNPNYRKDRVVESLGSTYQLHYPDYSKQSCRNIKQSAIHDKLQKQGAFFRDVSGWESPNWYSPNIINPMTKESFGREYWFEYWKKEHDACRQNVALFDMSFMSKFLIQGKDAGSFLNRLCTANVDDKCNKITYTQWLNEKGQMEADVTVTKRNDDSFLVVATDTMHNHVYMHMKRHLQNEQHVCITDVTGSYTQINIQGPKSRQLMESLTSIPMDNASFPFRHAMEIDIGYARAWCTRITYVGELGYELFIPVEFSSHIYDQIVDKGLKYNLKHAGLRALGSLRMEKAYRDYGHDMDNTDTIVDCGLSFTCDFNKELGFMGMDHVLAQKEWIKQHGYFKRLVQVFVSDPDILLHHGEVVWRNNERICDIRSASYGHTLNGAVGLAMLETKDEPITKEYLQNGYWEIETPEKKVKCELSLSSMYDPKNKRIHV